MTQGLSRKRIAFMIGFRSHNPAVMNAVAAVKARPRHDRLVEVRMLSTMIELAHHDEIVQAIERQKIKQFFKSYVDQLQKKGALEPGYCETIWEKLIYPNIMQETNLDTMLRVDSVARVAKIVGVVGVGV